MKEQLEAPNYNDNKILDGLMLNKSQFNQGMIKSFIFTIIAIFIFFVPVTINGATDISFGFIYKFIKSSLGILGLWFVLSIVVVNGFLSVYAKFMSKNKSSKIYQYYEEDSKIHVLLYLVGSAFSFVYLLFVTFDAAVPMWLVGSHTGGSIIPVVLDVAWIIPVGSFFMPFLLNYGIVDFIGSLMEPLMRPVFKVPGKSAVNAIASFVSSSSVGVLITSKLMKTGVYTKKEAVIIATGFSAVSVGFAYMVIETAGLSEYFIPVYFSSMLITLIVSFFMCRIPPVSTKPSVYLDGSIQDLSNMKNESSYSKGMLKLGFNRAVKKAYTAPNLVKEISSSLLDGYYVLPKVISLMSAVGVTALLIASYTPIFDWIGFLFEPLLTLLRVPNAAEIAPSFSVGIAEMFLPVLLIADQIDILSEGARYMVVAVSMVQIIFFSETVVVMISTKIPISLTELIMCFFERTIIAIPISAIFMHLMF